MFIDTTGYYIPKTRLPNDYFTELSGLTSDWMYQRSGILTRSRANSEETMNYMCQKAVEDALPKLPYNIQEVDLILFASYTPSDTIGTVAHHIQREYDIKNAKAFLISSACSSAINAMEIIKSFFETGISSKALLVCGERNSTYSDDADYSSGHLWGDAAVAMFFSKEALSDNPMEVIDITSQGLGHIGRGPQGVFLTPAEDGLKMPYGKDVFLNACTYIANNTQDILDKNGYTVDNLSYFIGHQANMRILKNVSKQLSISDEKVLTNIQELGNTGSASAPLVFAQNYDSFTSKDLICLSVFGGGYSAGSCLIRIY